MDKRITAGLSDAIMTHRNFLKSPDSMATHSIRDCDGWYEELSQFTILLNQKKLVEHWHVGPVYGESWSDPLMFVLE